LFEAILDLKDSTHNWLMKRGELITKRHRHEGDDVRFHQVVSVCRRSPTRIKPGIPRGVNKE